MDPIRQTRRQRPVPQPEDLELWALIQGGFSCLATRSKLSLRTYSIQTVFSQFDMPIKEHVCGKTHVGLPKTKAMRGEIELLTMSF